MTAASRTGQNENVQVSGEHRDLCAKCKTRPATLDWVGEGAMLAYLHGMTARMCEFCATTAQLKYAKEQAARIQELEKKLETLR